jgi:hypothetical protein
MQHVIDDCLTHTFVNSTAGGLVSVNTFGITGLYEYSGNVFVMTRVGNQDWGMQ